MSAPVPHALDSLADRGRALAWEARERGFATLDLGRELASAGKGWSGAWDDLPRDPYLAPRWGERRRRFAAFELELGGENEERGTWSRIPGALHVQGRAYNRLFGDLPRRFEALPESFLHDPFVDGLRGLYAACLRALGVASGERLLAELHAFRVAPRGGRAWPTPEGIHQDGRDWVFVLLAGREGIEGGSLGVYDGQRRALARHGLRDAGLLVLLDDRRVWHAAEPITGSGRRDVLVATFRSER